MTPFPIIETERLTLRAPIAEDVSVFTAFYADAAGSGSYGGPRRADQAFAVLCVDIGHWHVKGFGKWMLVRRTDGAVMGGCGLVHPDGWPCHELTWWLLPEHRGNGYAQEASKAVIAFGYDTLGWNPVETHIRDENRPAKRLIDALGGVKSRRETLPDDVTRNIYSLPHPTGATS